METPPSFTDRYEIEAAIAKINARIQSGVKSISSDGTSTTIDLNVLREERRRLIEQLNLIAGHTTRRPVASRINLG